FPADREVPACADGYGVQVRLDAMELHRPRQWGACWLACQLYEQLGLDRVLSARLADSRQRAQWRHIFQTPVCYRVIQSRQRVVLAPAVVRAERNGRLAGHRLCID